MFGQTDHLLFLRKPLDRVAVKQIALTLTTKWELDRKNRERFRESEEKYKDLFENNPGLVYTHDEKGYFIVTNLAWKDFGYTEHELVGMNMKDLIPESFKSEYKDYLKRIIKNGKDAGYVNLTTKDGKIRIMTYKSKLIEDSEGKPLYVQGSAGDITEQIQAEKALRESQAQLVQAQKMQAIGTLAGGIAHDLNNVLSGLVSYPDFLLMGMPEDDPLRKPILTIKKSGEKAATIVQDLLTLARRGVMVEEIVNLNQAISEYLKTLEYQTLISFHSKVETETNLATDLLNVKGSPVHLSKVVMNLISNAAEAMPYGGRVCISTENRYVDRPIRGYENIIEGDYVILSVSDTGLGISSEDMERIFEPFYTKKVMGRSGTGLGMAVVWGTTKDHNGYIDVKSKPGKGTTFTLYFPASREKAAKIQSRLSIEDFMGKGESVLVVDDVKEQQEIASGILKRLGYSVTFVSSGEEAVAYMTNNMADILVLDMIMDGGIDGLETYKRIFASHPSQKAIIVSGFSETARVKEALRLGVGAYIKKPYTLDNIGLAVREELDK